MTPDRVKRALATAAGFLMMLSVGLLVPVSVPIMAAVQGETAGDGPFGPFLTRPALVVCGAVWLVAIVGGILGGARHPDRAFFRGAFFASFIVTGCAAILAVAFLALKIAAIFG